MTSIYLIIALSLLSLGVIGSLIPIIPGPLFSMIGILFYWTATGFQEPHTFIVLLLTTTALFAVIIDYIAAYIGAKESGASNKTSKAAAISTIPFFLILGPFGIIIGPIIVVYLREKMTGKNQEEAFKSAKYTTLALIASTAVKTIISLIILSIFVISVFLF